MVLRFTYQSFFNNNTGHFLLASGTLQLLLTFDDNSQLTINVPKNAVTSQGFTVKLDAPIFPDKSPVPTIGLKKKKLVKMRCQYSLLLSALSRSYELLRIVQIFTATPGQDHSDTRPVYQLSPSGWENSAGQLKTGNMATHPLVGLGKLSIGEISLNALVVNLTALWKDLHSNNLRFTVTQSVLSDMKKVSLQVFGNLSGNAFIWYASVPRYLEQMTTVSPHTFFMPSDNAELQNLAKDSDYLLNNQEHFNNDGRSLFKYLWPPLPDTAVPQVPSSIGQAIWKSWRNVLGFEYLTAAHTTIGTKQWSLYAGFEKAFYGEGGVQPKQFLLLPQNTGSGAQSIKGIQTLGPADALKQITDTITLVLQTNTSLLAKDAADAVTIDKMIVSAYSESGYDLWWAVKSNLKRLKAIIAIEPQNLNKIDNDYGTNPPIGIDLLPALIKEGSCKIFMIGRHHAAKYKPAIPDASSIHFLPANAGQFFQYPPVPASNPFVRYRIERMTDASLDPLMAPEEKSLLNDLATGTPPITGADALKKIFHPWGDKDCTCGTPNCECTDGNRESWYSHQFALSGGQIMQLPASGNIYNQPITYRSFFHEAVEQIG